MKARLTLTAATLGLVLVAASPAEAITPGGASALEAPIGPPVRVHVQPNVDVRQDQAEATVASKARRARSGLEQSLGQSAVVESDEVTGGLDTVARIDGYLTSPSSADAADVALGYVRGHLAAFGLTAADVDALTLDQESVSSDGIVHLRWTQKVDGIVLFDRQLRAAVDAQGRLLNVQGAPVHAPELDSSSPTLSSRDAIVAAQKAADIPVDVAPVETASNGAARKTIFTNDDSTMLVVFPTEGGEVLAYRAITIDPRTEWTYGSVVDATTGKLLYRTSLTAEANMAQVFDIFPGAPGAAGVQHNVDLSPWLDAPSTTKVLAGNNVQLWEDVNDDGVNQPEEEVVPSTGTTPSQWSYTHKTYQPAQMAGQPGALCPTAGCSWNFAVGTDQPQSWVTNSDQTATQSFYYINSYHDYIANGPFKFDAKTAPFEGTDRLKARMLAGALGPGGNPDTDHLNNAIQTTLPDGQSPSMRMYLFAPINAGDQETQVNGGDDATVLMHEYQHSVTGRTITDASGMQAMSDAQSGAMNEAWSDFFALDYLYGSGFATDQPGVVDVTNGVYLSKQPTGKGFRTQSIDCPVGTGGGAACPGANKPGNRSGPGGYTYADFGQINGTDKPEVHDDGEIWSETLWDVRAKIGHDDAVAVVAGGLKMTPPSPSFLQARDAILQAALTRGGLNLQYAVSQAFAGRGMGVNARTLNAADAKPTEDFTALPAPVNCPTGQVLPAGSACPAPAPPPPIDLSAFLPKKKTPALIRTVGRASYNKKLGRIAIRVECTITCKGRIRLKALDRTLKFRSSKRGKRRSSLSFNLKAGKRRTLKLYVSKRDMRRFAKVGGKRRTVKVRITLTGQGTGAQSKLKRVTRPTLTVKKP